MIPALGTCVFVIYLYRSLNQPEKAEPLRANDSSDAAASLDELVQRLSALESRLQSLANDNPAGRASS